MTLNDFNVIIDISTDILIFTSHNENKKSYHIIIDHYYHMNNLEAKAFYNEIISKISPNFTKFIDHSVYSSIQQYRIVGSQKVNSNRPKIIKLEL